MPYISYQDKNYHQDTLELIQRCREITDQYVQEGFDLTVRQLYYQLVSRAYIPNNERSYKRIMNTVSDARMTGHIDWDTIVDRTRNLRSNSHWETPGDIVSTAARQFQLDKWLVQDERVEVWIEKDALIGVIGDRCQELDVSYFSCRGYSSQSEMWRGAQRILQRLKQYAQKTVILHLADHDPSGIDMTRDIRDRLTTFVGRAFECPFEVERIALLESQVQIYDPPPNPTKLTDSRSDSYVTLFGYDSWELDALDPKILVNLIQDHVLEHRDEELWSEYVQREVEAKEQLTHISDNFDAVADFVGSSEPW